MKRTFLFSLMCAAALVGAISCTKDDPTKDDNNGDNGGNQPGQTTYTLIASPLSLSFGWSNPAAQSITVTTNAPDGFEIGTTADWYTAAKSGNKVVVTPQSNDGEKRTHELEIKANGATSVKILISQEPKGEIHASLKGSQYIVWHIDATSADFLGSKIVKNLAPDELTRFLFIWSNGETLVGESGTGPNFYGNQDGYMCFSAGTSGWSGAGYVSNVTDLAIFDEVAANPEGWYFHVAIKGTKGQGDSITLWAEAETNNYVIDWDTYLGNDPNEWCEVEIPMADILATGWARKVTGDTSGNANNLSFSAGGKAGNKISYDAMFVYKK